MKFRFGSKLDRYAPLIYLVVSLVFSFFFLVRVREMMVSRYQPKERKSGF